MVILLVSGHSDPRLPDQKSKAIMEIIDREGNINVCPQIANYPLEIEMAAGLYLPEILITVCGGKDKYWLRRTECHTLENGQWQLVGNLEIGRNGHGASAIGDNIWFTGKYKDREPGYLFKLSYLRVLE